MKRDLLKDFADKLDAVIDGTAVLNDAEREYLATPAPNAIEFITSATGLNMPSLYSHYGAYGMVRDYFQLLCPRCATADMYQTFRVTKRGNVNKSRWEYEGEPLLRWKEEYNDDQCPKCGVTRCELLDAGELRRHTQGIAIVGQRGGKSYTLGQIGVYKEHFLVTRAIKHGSVANYFDLPTSATFVSTCLAASAEQAEKTIWAYYTGHRRNAPWFQRLVPWVKAQEKTQIVPVGMRPWAYVENATSIEYGQWSWIMNSLNSNAATGRGGTRVWVLLDEISHFKDTDSAFGAQENYEAMQNALATVRARSANLGLPAFLGSIFAISSPRSLDDYGYRLMVTANENPSRYALHRATWEFNPDYPSPDCPGLQESRLSNPLLFWTNFGARPPSSAQPIHPDFESWRARTEKKNIKPILEPYVTQEMDSNGLTWLLADIDEEQLTKLRGQLMPPSGFVITCDAGQKFDSFALAIGHAAQTPSGRTTIPDCVFRIVPDENQEVLFASVETLIMRISEYLPITRIRFDRWQSAQIVQNLTRYLAAKNVDVAAETMKEEALIRFFREGAEGLLWMLPGDRQIERDARAADRSAQIIAWHELQNLQWDPKNGKIFNPKKGKVRGENSDDVARTLAYLHQEVQDLEVIDRDDNSKESLRKRAAAFTASSRVLGFGGFVPSAAGAVAPGGRGPGASGISPFATGTVESYMPVAMQVAQREQAAALASSVAQIERHIGDDAASGRYVPPPAERTRGPLVPPRVGGFFSTSGGSPHANLGVSGFGYSGGGGNRLGGSGGFGSGGNRGGRR